MRLSGDARQFQRVLLIAIILGAIVAVGVPYTATPLTSGGSAGERR
jgi:hypothetical protein